MSDSPDHCPEDVSGLFQSKVMVSEGMTRKATLNDKDTQDTTSAGNSSKGKWARRQARLVQTGRSSQAPRQEIPDIQNPSTTEEECGEILTLLQSKAEATQIATVVSYICNRKGMKERMMELKEGCLYLPTNSHMEQFLKFVEHPNPWHFIYMLQGSFFQAASSASCPSAGTSTSISLGGSTVRGCTNGLVGSDSVCLQSTFLATSGSTGVHVYMLEGMMGLDEAWESSMIKNGVKDQVDTGPLSSPTPPDVTDSNQSEPPTPSSPATGTASDQAQASDNSALRLNIPLTYYVCDPGDNSVFNAVTDRMLKDQTDVLNAGFAGTDSCSAGTTYQTQQAHTRIQFTQQSTVQLTNSLCGNYCVSNIHSLTSQVVPREDGLLKVLICKDYSWLGYSTLPVVPDSERICIITPGTLPGGSITGYNEGKTLTHAMGRYLGLYYTFQHQDCGSTGDEVDDTNPEEYPNWGCSFRETCGSSDPIHNFMDYSEDSCMCTFTEGQTQRLWASMSLMPDLLDLAETNCDSSTSNPAESSRTYSSVYNDVAPGGAPYAQSMLDSATAWTAKQAAVGEYMIIDVGEVTKIVGVITQASAYLTWEYVTAFTVQYSTDGSVWQDISGTFTGSWSSDKLEARFPTGVEARYVKLVAQSWVNWISMRAGAIVSDLVEVNPAESSRTYSSVHLGDAHGGGHARSMLDSPQAWVAKQAVAGEYMIIDVGQEAWIYGVITQCRADLYWEYVTSFTVQYSSDGFTWQDITGTFVGSSSANKLEAKFPSAVYAQYVKIVAQAWINWVSMRAGVLACKTTCNSVAFNPTETSRTYSGVKNDDTPGVGHARSRLDSLQAWSAKQASVGEYMIMDMAGVTEIGGVITQAREYSSEYVSSLTVQYSTDGSTWQEVAGTFAGSTAVSKLEAKFPLVIAARYLKLVAQSWNAWISMRAGTLLCTPPCLTATFNPGEASRTYSSVHNDDAPGVGHAQSMLDSTQGWSAKQCQVGEWMIMDVGHVAWIKGVITQARADLTWEYVTSFTVQHSSDFSDWDAMSGTFTGSSTVDKLEAKFPAMVRARYVKLVVQSWVNWVSMRAGILACESDDTAPETTIQVTTTSTTMSIATSTTTSAMEEVTTTAVEVGVTTSAMEEGTTTTPTCDHGHHPIYGDLICELVAHLKSKLSAATQKLSEEMDGATQGRLADTTTSAPPALLNVLHRQDDLATAFKEALAESFRTFSDRIINVVHMKLDTTTTSAAPPALVGVLHPGEDLKTQLAMAFKEAFSESFRTFGDRITDTLRTGFGTNTTSEAPLALLDVSHYQRDLKNELAPVLKVMFNESFHAFNDRITENLRTQLGTGTNPPATELAAVWKETYADSFRTFSNRINHAVRAQLPTITNSSAPPALPQLSHHQEDLKTQFA